MTDPLRSWLQLTETALLAPWIAARRLQQVGTLPWFEAAGHWNAWGMEKAVAFSESALRGWAVLLRAAPQTVPQALSTAAHVLQPVRRRVKRNARRRRR